MTLRYAQIHTPKSQYDVFVTHWSYSKNSQCFNAAHVLKFIHDLKPKNVILLGDFNTYADFETPMSLITEGHSCNDVSSVTSLFTRSYTFTDVWKLLRPSEKGLTFSLMPWPGLQSRPDRMYVSLMSNKIDYIQVLVWILWKLKFSMMGKNTNGNFEQFIYL